MLFPQQCWEENELAYPVYCNPYSEIFVYIWQSYNWVNFCVCLLFSPTFRAGERQHLKYQLLNNRKIVHWKKKKILVHAKGFEVQSTNCNSDCLKHIERTIKNKFFLFHTETPAFNNENNNVEEHANFALLLSHYIPREGCLCHGMSVYSYFIYYSWKFQ